MRTSWKKIMEEYQTVYEDTIKNKVYKHPLGNVITDIIPSKIEKTLNLSSNIYKVKGSHGVGRWARIPWIAIFNKRLTDTAKQGVYIVYLVNPRNKELFLTLNQGATEVISGTIDKFNISVTGAKNTSANNILRTRANEIRKLLHDEELFYDEGIDTGSEAYDAGCIYYKKYTLDNLPNDNGLIDDLNKYIKVYQKYVDMVFNGETVEIERNMEYENSMEVDKHEEIGSLMNVKESIETIKEYIESKGFSYEEGLIENFYLSLKSKPFVILAGISGTGKTRLVKLFAEALGATDLNGQYKLISVRPDWSDSSDLFGYVDLNGKFICGPITRCIEEANNNLNKPYFLCLDEMNLARVEYYLSDVLSIMETRDFKNGRIITDGIRINGHKDITIPENLYIIGTVNMDETTFPFSKKVLDRANTIEFSYVDLMPDFEKECIRFEKETKVSNSFLKTEYLYLNECNDEEVKIVKDICEELQEINEILKNANAHVGYRVRDEISFYMLNNYKNKLLDSTEAFDNEILQKILPRIQGSGNDIREVICDLFRYCASDYVGYRTDLGDAGKQMFKVLETEKVKYPKSANKLAYMMRRYEKDGFTSYWI